MAIVGIIMLDCASSRGLIVSPRADMKVRSCKDSMPWRKTSVASLLLFRGTYAAVAVKFADVVAIARTIQRSISAISMAGICGVAILQKIAAAVPENFAGVVAITRIRCASALSGARPVIVRVRSELATALNHVNKCRSCRRRTLDRNEQNRKRCSNHGAVENTESQPRQTKRKPAAEEN